MRALMTEFMAALPARDWPRLSATLAPHVERIGPEGSEGDGVVGRDGYVSWLAGFADPLYEYGWTVHRIIYSDDGRTAVVDCSTRYLLTREAEPFGYRLVMVFDMGDSGLIERVDLYWKTPRQRVPGDTIAAGKR